MADRAPEFERQVFANFPYDAEYAPLARALLFTVLDCGFEPRLAAERADSGEVRLAKIRELIGTCRFSIHDISRIEALHSGDLPRFNMAFELGLDLGCRYFGEGALVTKQCLILERDRFRYQRVLSDISGNDIRAHNGEPEALVRQVRNWLQVVGGGKLPSGSQVWKRFSLFQSHVALLFARLHYTRDDVSSLEFTEFLQFVREWKISTRGAGPRRGRR